MVSNTIIDRKSEAAIFSRVVDRSLSEFSEETARSLLKLGFSEEDHAIIDDLTTRNQEGTLSAEEKEELLNFVKVGNLLAVFQSKARKFLKEHGSK